VDLPLTADSFICIAIKLRLKRKNLLRVQGAKEIFYIRCAFVRAPFLFPGFARKIVRLF
jgi:hypothetical protein